MRSRRRAVYADMQGPTSHTGTPARRSRAPVQCDVCYGVAGRPGGLEFDREFPCRAGSAAERS
eukprot:1197664-Lingulodinium_polyedra.AAC.1